MKPTFNNLPKSIKEEIWSYLTEEEIFKLRIICKDWKDSLDNPKSIHLKERIQRCKEKSEK